MLALGAETHIGPRLDRKASFLDGLGQRRSTGSAAPPLAPRQPVGCQRDDPVWTAALLRQSLQSLLGGRQVIVVSNREPYSHELVDGKVQMHEPASGLTTAMRPVIDGCGGSWIAHGSGTADRDVVDADGVFHARCEGGHFRLRRVWLSAAQEVGYLEGFSNAALWPLCHQVHVRPVFHEPDWDHYRAVNGLFADAVVDEATCADPVVLVHDYHLALLPALLRERLPRATIVSFWHIPWAHAQQMRACPWLPALIDGLIASDIVGFQTPEHRRNFIHSVRDVGRQGFVSRVAEGGERVTAVTRVYPISIAWPTARERLAMPSVGHCRAAALSRWGLPADGKLIVGVDRFDYTKGWLERLRAVEQLLLDEPGWRGRLRLVQVAAPTRSSLPAYARLRREVEAAVRRLNRRFAIGPWEPVVLLDTHHDRAQVNALYRAADVCVVTSLHDGMNLVCKEFAAARDDEQGVLVLSRFAGASETLGEALLVNPHHASELAQALHRGLRMNADEARQRMRALRDQVRHHNVHRWAASMLIDVARLKVQTAVAVGVAATAG